MELRTQPPIRDVDAPLGLHHGLVQVGEVILPTNVPFTGALPDGSEGIKPLQLRVGRRFDRLLQPINEVQVGVHIRRPQLQST